MKKVFIASLLVLLLTCLVVFIGLRYGNWSRTFNMPNTSYSIVIPGLPAYGERGTDVTRYYVYHHNETKDVLYLMEYFEFSDNYNLNDDSYVLEKIANEDAIESETDILELKHSKQLGLPVVDVVFVNKEKTNFRHTRYMLDKNKKQAIVIMVEGLKQKDKLPEVIKFQESFKIKAK